MTTPNFIPGRRYLLKRWDGVSSYKFLAVATAHTLKKTNEFADTTAPDENNPTAIPNRKSVKTSRQWDVSFSGMLDAAKRAAFEADCDGEDPVPYAFELVPENGTGAGYHAGQVHFETLEFGKQDKGMVSFSVTARGDDALTWADGAAP